MEQTLTGFENPDTDFILNALDSRYSSDRHSAFGTLANAPDDTQKIVGMLGLRAFSLAFHLRRGFVEADVQYLSWAGRSLLELKFFTEYCLASDENMSRFVRDAYVDASTAFEVAGKNVKAISDHAMKEESHQILDWIDSHLRPVLDEQQVSKDDGYLTPSAIAKSLGAYPEFGIVNMLFSKFAHMTALSALLPFESGERLALIRALLLQVGAMNAIFVADRPADHIPK